MTKKRSDEILEEMEAMGIGIGGRHCTIMFEYLDALLSEWYEEKEQKNMSEEEWKAFLREQKNLF